MYDNENYCVNYNLLIKCDENIWKNYLKYNQLNKLSDYDSINENDDLLSIDSDNEDDVNLIKGDFKDEIIYEINLNKNIRSKSI